MSMGFNVLPDAVIDAAIVTIFVSLVDFLKLMV